MRILITGGAGFVGSNLALQFAQAAGSEITCLDNLKRRGSELALARLASGGVKFVHGDIRNPADIEGVGPFDLLLECSAEPSVHAGYGGSPAYLIDTNLVGTINCLEAARKCNAAVVFLSTSRVYPIAGLRKLPLQRTGQRLDIPASASGLGWSAAGISTEFPLAGSRSLYGATKLASELLIEEYVAMYGLRAVTNRCGVLSGPWQMGKVDQGFIVLWASRHLYGGKLAYMGFGGEGLQVRDVLHVRDLYDLIRVQISDWPKHSGQTYNVGGGHARSVSLAELTEKCKARSGTSPEFSRDPETRPADIPYYITDNTHVTRQTGWQPQISVDQLLDEIFAWLRDHRSQLEPILR
ncbi:MAG TPA: NAD-dependent epimerase/dehydratase family protein [Tepidisphaeraceae bacterium]|jgi:CDP-paratose 2-epimerase